MFRWSLSSTLAIMIMFAAVPTTADDANPERPSRSGIEVEDFTLDNCYGKSVTLSEVAQGKPVTIVFMGTECPLAKLDGGRLSNLRDRFGSQVEFLGICSKEQDSMTELTAFARRYPIGFP